MNHRGGLAIEPKEEPEGKENPANEQEQWNQEQEKFRNERAQGESVQEKLQRLIPSFDFRKLVL